MVKFFRQLIKNGLTRLHNALTVVWIPLNAEFRRQKDEGVKESIRRAMNDVFNQHLAMGNLDEALKLYSRGIREYCTQPGNLIEMLLNWITATVYAEQWSKLGILLPQVDRAVSEVQERDIPSSSAQNAQRGGPSTSNTKSARNARELVASSTAKVAAVSGLNSMKRSDFKTAAQRFISIDLESFNYPELLSQNDVAVYGAICALATYDRNALKTDVLGSSQFRKFLESEPKLIELLQKFCRNQFGASLDILTELRDQLLLNVYLAPHVPNLYTCIRRRAIVQFFQPYVTVGMVMMAEEFRTSVDALEEELVDLIRSGLLSARIDSHQQIVEAKVVDRRSEVFDRSIKASKAVDSLAHTLLIRATLQELKCIVGLESNSRQKSSCSKIF
ncbi:PCI domain-containing protein [Aphelenchoides bicaudatus]|nr:PCI domain-containing protein [Aphelenchoides bicaudatus]